MLKPVPFANAAAVVVAVVYVICRLLVGMMPNGMFNLMRTWVHTVNLEGLQMVGSLSLGSFIWGLIVMVVMVWLVVYATIVLYNSFAKE